MYRRSRPLVWKTVHVYMVAVTAFCLGAWTGATIIGYLVREQRQQAGTYRPAETITVPWVPAKVAPHLPI